MHRRRRRALHQCHVRSHYFLMWLYLLGSFFFFFFGETEKKASARIKTITLSGILGYEKLCMKCNKNAINIMLSILLRRGS